MNKTIRKVGYAVLTEGSAGEITYGTPIWFKSDEAGGRSIGAEPIGDSNTIYADGLPIIVASANSGYTISLELISAGLATMMPQKAVLLRRVVSK